MPRSWARVATSERGTSYSCRGPSSRKTTDGVRGRYRVVSVVPVRASLICRSFPARRARWMARLY